MNKEINYYGIDLFEDITPEIMEQESSIETWSIRTVQSQLDALKIGTIRLFKGFSENILLLDPFDPTKLKFDLIFVDGGHSLKTATSDILRSLELVSDKGVIFIDDYSDELPGVKQAVDNLICSMKKEILNEHTDTYRENLYRMVKLSWN